MPHTERVAESAAREIDVEVIIRVSSIRQRWASSGFVNKSTSMSCCVLLVELCLAVNNYLPVVLNWSC